MSDARSPCSTSVRRASLACSATPTLYSEDAPQAAIAPRATEDMAARHDRAVAGIAALAAAAHAGPALCRYSPALCGALGVRDRLADPTTVALTFDDGPHPRGTPATLEVLRAAGVRATFFVVGEQVERHRATTAEIAAAGHAIAVHCHRHRNLLRLTPTRVREDLLRAEDALAGATAATIAADAAGGLRGGEVILLHDADHYSAHGSWQRTVAALPRILDRAGDAGLAFV